MSWIAQPLGPALILIFGALALVLIRSLGWHRVALWWVLAVNLAALTAWLLLRLPTAILLVGRDWSSALLYEPGGLTWQVIPWTWGGVGIVLLLSLSASLVGWDEEGRLGLLLRATDLTVAGVATAVLFAGNMLTLASMWILMESAALLRLMLEPEGRAETGRVSLAAASSLMIALACVLAGPELLTSPLTSARLSALSQACVLLAIALRAAAFPFHGWLLHARLVHIASRLSVYLVPAMTGLWLLGVVNSWTGMAWWGGVQWLILLSVALLGSAIAAWADHDPDTSLDLVYANRSALILLTVALWAGSGPLPLVGWLISFGLGLALLWVADPVYREGGGRWPAALAILTLAGFPLTAGFLSIVWLARLAPPSGHALIWALVAISDGLILATMWQRWTASAPRPPQQMTGREARLLSVTVLLSVPLLFAALRPAGVTAMVGAGAGAPGLLALLAGARAAVWAHLLLAVAIALWLTYNVRHLTPEWRPLLRRLVWLARLDWMYGAILVMGRAVALTWRGILEILEGEGYLGWVIVTVLILWVASRL
ncbi:MAG: hypothetical protein Kow0047_22560 [Anaerolineae bacterium]